MAKKWFGNPYPDVVKDAKTEKTTAYFDIEVGTLIAGIVHEGAVAASVTCATNGAPILRARLFPLAGAMRSTSLKLRDDRSYTITLQNVGLNEDGDDDFGIHFRVVPPELRPKDRVTPSSKPECLTLLPIPDPAPPRASIGPGCSNSLFP